MYMFLYIFLNVFFVFYMVMIFFDNGFEIKE